MANKEGKGRGWVRAEGDKKSISVSERRAQASVELSADRAEKGEKIFGFFGFINTIKRTNGKLVR